MDDREQTPAAGASVKVGKIALSLAPIVVLGRTAGFFVPIAIAHFFGVSGVTDAFFYAMAIPMLLVVIVTNAVGTIVTPHLAKVHAEEPAEIPRFLGGVISLLTVGVTGIGGLTTLGMYLLLPLISDFDSPTRSIAVSFTAELIPLMALASGAAILKAATEVQGSYVRAAIAPLPRAFVIIAVLLICSPYLQGHALPLAMGLGAAAEVSWFLRALRSAGVVLHPNLTLDPRIRRAAMDVLPLLVGQSLVALHLLVDRSFAASLDTGGVSILDYADKLRLIPQVLAEGTLLPVAFATWAHQKAREQHQQFARQLDQSFRWVAAWSAAPLAALHIFRFPLVDLLFVRGEFTAEDGLQTAEAFGWFVPGLWFLFLGSLALRANIIEDRLRLIMVLGGISLGLKIIFDALLVGPMGVQGLTLATTLVWLIIPTTYMAALLPTLTAEASPKKWAPVLVIAAASLAIALGVELRSGAVRTTTIWPALVCLLLWAMGIGLTLPKHDEKS
ncbi:MAG: hypothetical protein HN348_08940 [Proteobacteria bacterium]|jgi:putative peptidoglycan lipid II flippase|nr:hypothetical protein [Pseudomonadota bacterium]